LSSNLSEHSIISVPYLSSTSFYLSNYHLKHTIFDYIFGDTAAQAVYT
jgi:hypothetical protein